MVAQLGPLNQEFIYSLRTVTEAAACAAFEWIGRGEKERGDGAAVDAMRTTLNRLPLSGVIVSGEGEKDQAPELYKGERVGSGGGEIEVDLAVDPVEGTSYMAKGLTNAMATIAVAPRGTLFDPGPAFYMEKFAGPPAVKSKIKMSWTVNRKLNELAEILGKRVDDLTIYVLEKPRHRKMVEDIHALGARVALYPAGDVAGALMAAIPGSGIDALMGTGGTPEGILSACAIRALGGEFLGRLDPQLHTEKAAVAKAKLDTRRWYTVEEIAAAKEVMFCATGITSGLLFEGVDRAGGQYRLQTLMISGLTGERQILTNYLPRAEPPSPT